MRLLSTNSRANVQRIALRKRKERARTYKVVSVSAVVISVACKPLKLKKIDINLTTNLPKPLHF